MGGMLRAIEQGFVQREIQESAYRAQRAVESGEAVIVGVNRFRSEQQEPIELMVVDEKAGENQRAAFGRLRASRDAEQLHRSLERLRESAQGRENLLPAILESVEALATVGEISDSLRSVYGEYRESVII